MSFQPSTFTTVPTDWARIDAAVDELLGLDPAEWPAAIERLARGDAGMADELHHLLATAVESRHYGVRPARADASAPHWRDLDRETLAMAAQLRAGAGDGDERGAGPPSRPVGAASAGLASRAARHPAPAASGRGRLVVAILAGLAGAVLVHWLHG